MICYYIKIQKMIWKECYLHIAFALSSLVLMFLNFIGGLSYLLVRRYEQEDKLEDFVKTAEEVRSNLNFAYLVLSFIFMSVTLISGILRAQSAWRTFFDIKIFTTIIIVSYLLIATLIILYRRIKKKTWQRHLALFSLFSIFLIVLSLSSNFLSKHHQYLRLLFP